MASVKIYFDGGLHRQRICVYDLKKHKYMVKSMAEKCKSKHSSNELEYQALIQAIKYAKRKYKNQNIEFVGDSKLVIGQVWHGWNINFPHLMVLFEEVMINLSKLKAHNGIWVKRENNVAGIHLENLLMLDKGQKIYASR